MSTILTNNDLAQDLYRSLLEDLPAKSELPKLIVVQHLVRNSLPLFQALNHHFDICGIVPKPKSKDSMALEMLTGNPDRAQRIPVVEVSREEFDASANPFDHFDSKPDERGVIVLDIGGYFAKSISKPAFGNHVRAIIEDTENGHQKYLAKLQESPVSFPIASVARSPLKEPEDFLVGQSIVYSCENILRENYSLLINKQTLVIGYGKIGRSIATSLSARNINVWVYDKDPVKRAQAMAHGFSVPEREFAISNAGLIFCATGQKSLSTKDLKKLQNYAFIASVTSSDDEFNFTGFDKDFKREKGDGIHVCQSKKANGKVFYLIRGGEAANFAHSNTLGVYIYLVACEIIGCLRGYVNDSKVFAKVEGIDELQKRERDIIAEAWIETFFGKGLT